MSRAKATERIPLRIVGRETAPTAPTSDASALRFPIVRPRAEFALGWLPDVPDYRDRTPHAEDIKTLFKSGKPVKTAALPRNVNLRGFCSPVENQQNIGSCTAQAVVGLVEYFQNRTEGEFLDGSRLFLYRVTRKLYGFEGDTGAYIRGTIRALRIFGVCPEDYWPYKTTEFDNEPTPFCYAFGQNYKAVKYYRLWDDNPSTLLEQLKGSLANELPFAFGFSVYSSIWDPEVQRTGDIPVPKKGDKLDGGHAVMAIGYDDDKGCLLIRNSWGSGWGDSGYGTLPYEYAEKGIADDFWVLVTADYVSLLGL